MLHRKIEEKICNVINNRSSFFPEYLLHFPTSLPTSALMGDRVVLSWGLSRDGVVVGVVIDIGRVGSLVQELYT